MPVLKVTKLQATLLSEGQRKLTVAQGFTQEAQGQFLTVRALVAEALGVKPELIQQVNADELTVTVADEPKAPEAPKAPEPEPLTAEAK